MNTSLSWVENGVPDFDGAGIYRRDDTVRNKSGEVSVWMSIWKRL